MAWLRSRKKGSGGGGISNILKGTSNPASSIGDNGQLYLKYAQYEKHSFMSGAIIVVENQNDSTDIKLYVNGLTKDSSFLSITDTDLLTYLSDITSGYLKACSTYDTADSTTQTGILAIGDWGSGIGIHTYVPGWLQYKSGTFYGVIDLNEAPVAAVGQPYYQPNPYVDPDTFIDGGITNSFAKVGGAWQDLIGTVIDDILAGGSKYIKATGSFTSASSGGTKVEVNCGFKPDLVIVDMEFGNGYTRATYLSTAWFETTDHPSSTWDLRPMENVIYGIIPGSEYGETGITDITNTGFKYRSNGGNTLDKACTYTAIKIDVEKELSSIILSNGQISDKTSGEYKYPVYEDISSYDTVNVKIYGTIDNVYYEDYISINCSRLPQQFSNIRLYDENGNSWNKSLNLIFSSTALTSISYTGSYENLYIDMIALKE